jgi:hypothetical protein
LPVLGAKNRTELNLRTLVVVNSTDGGQTVTITDPNSGKRAMLPTFDRGKPPNILKMQTEEDFKQTTEKVFQHSMI